MKVVVSFLLLTETKRKWPSAWVARSTRRLLAIGSLLFAGDCAGALCSVALGVGTGLRGAAGPAAGDWAGGNGVHHQADRLLWRGRSPKLHLSCILLPVIAPCGAGAPLFPLVHLLPHLYLYGLWGRRLKEGRNLFLAKKSAPPQTKFWLRLCSAG